MKETTVKKYTCDYCGYMTIVHSDGTFRGDTIKTAKEHEDNCFYNPKHKKCATCKHRITTHLSNTAICIAKTISTENMEKGLYVAVGVGDSCAEWEINTRPAPWYDHKNKRISNLNEEDPK